MHEEKKTAGVIEEKNLKELRVHHLLCIPLFRGAGYSGAFSENMTKKIRELKASPKEEVHLVCRADMICEKCPNRNEDGTCGSDKNHVAVKDRELLGVFGLEEGGMYPAEELFQIARRRLTKVEFDRSCKNCEWYQKGYCSYEEYQKGAAALSD